MTQDHDIWQWQEPGKAWKGSGLYHITLKIPTCEPLLGDLVIPDNDPTQAYIKHLPLGDALLLCLREFPNYHPEIQVLHYCLMPDHLHMIWYVRQAMPRSIRMVVSGFRSALLLPRLSVGRNTKKIPYASNWAMMRTMPCILSSRRCRISAQ